MIFFTICFIFLTGCQQQKSDIHFFAMDTFMEVTIYQAAAESLLIKVQDRVNELEQIFSSYIPHSDIYVLNHSNEAEQYPASEVIHILTQAIEVAKKTNGAFNPAIGALTDLWNFGSEEPQVPSQEQIHYAAGYCGYHSIELKQNAVRLPKGVKLDFGGAAKGYAADEAVRLLKNHEVKSALISFGGNVYALGKRMDGEPFKIGIADPCAKIPYVGYINAEDTSVVTSGGYQRFFIQNQKRYSHILDPQTGYPAESGLLSATVVCENSAYADMLSTAFYVMGAEKALDFCQQENGALDVVLITSDQQVFVSDGLKDSFTFCGQNGGYTYYEN